MHMATYDVGTAINSKAQETKILHAIIRKLTDWALSSFFMEIRVIGEEYIPKEGPVIVTATHHNMMLDPAVLSVSFPHRRMLNFWSKASLFANPVASWILQSSGNIPVDRKSKDRNILFKGTFEVLSQNGVVALFPEGTSYTEPRIMQVKDGAAWAALEYSGWHQENFGAVQDQDLTVVSASIVYTNKTKYRSAAIVEFGRPISLERYKSQFLSTEQGAQKIAVKRLTRTIEEELVSATINAPDWDTLYAARMTRELLWERNNSISLDDFVAISQTLVDLFSAPNVAANVISVKQHLLEYYSLLQSSHLTNSVLSSLPLPRVLDPNSPAPLPSRLYTIMILIRDSIAALIRLPFFIFPLTLHLPVYVMCRFGARLVKDEEETQAQNKVVFGFLSSLLIYPTTFFFLWALLWYTPLGALLSAVFVYMSATYHTRMIDENYESGKRLVAAWRILVGVWIPKRWDLSLAALSQYTTPVIPKENPWIDKPRVAAETLSEATPPGVNNLEEPPVKTRPKRRPPSRRLVRHVLRARVEAIKSLSTFFDHLQKSERSKQFPASVHLARSFGIVIDKDSDEINQRAEGWRNVHEIIGYLFQKGANIPTHTLAPNESEWAALISEADGEGNLTVDSA